MSFVPNIKFKTEYCMYWQQGNNNSTQGKYVRRGHTVSSLMDSRNFAAQMRQFSTNTQSVIFFFFCSKLESPGNHQATRVWRQFQPSQIKQLQDHFLQVLWIRQKSKDSGTCKLGEKCTYAHERRQKRKKKMSHDTTHQSNTHQINQQWTPQQLQQYYIQQQQYYSPAYYYPYSSTYSYYPITQSTLPNVVPQLSPNYNPAYVPQNYITDPASFPSMQQKAQILQHADPSPTSKEQAQSVSPSCQSPASNKTDSTVLKARTSLDNSEKPTQFNIDQ